MARPKSVQSPSGGAAKVWGEELKFWRKRARMTQSQLADAVPCNQSWISELENGNGTPTPELASCCDEILGTSGVLRRNLTYVAREAKSAYHPDWFRHYVELEARAVTLHEWYPYGIPGLLQTEAYMRQQFAGWHRADRVHELTEARLSRLERLFGTVPLRLHAIVDESVLRRRIGGVEVMGPQLSHLLAIGRRPNVTVQVVPLDRPVLATVDSTIAFLGMPDGQTWFYTEGLDHGRLTEDLETVAAHQSRYDLLRASALSEPESRQLIRRILGELINVSSVVDVSDVRFFKSSYSGGGNGCVGTSRDLLAQGLAPVVDTTLGASSPVLAFTAAAFTSFVDAVKSHDPAFAAGEQYVTP